MVVQLTRFGKIVFGVIVIAILSLLLVNYISSLIFTSGIRDIPQPGRYASAADPLAFPEEVRIKTGSRIELNFEFLNTAEVSIKTLPIFTKCVDEDDLEYSGYDNLPELVTPAADILVNQTHQFRSILSLKSRTEYVLGKTYICSVSMVDKNNHSQIYRTKSFYLDVRS